MGVVEPCGLGDAVSHGAVASSDLLREDCLSSNKALLETLRPDVFENDLMQQAKADAALGRMTEPMPGGVWWLYVGGHVMGAMCLFSS
jgi:hypothetical protein